MFSMSEIIGLKVVAIKGFSSGNKKIEPQFILFSDGKTYIEFSEQDEYAYHDCSLSARHISIIQNERQFVEIMRQAGNANIDI